MTIVEIATLEATISQLKELRIGDLQSKKENLLASAAVTGKQEGVV
jgi:hypothetical protein